MRIATATPIKAYRVYPSLTVIQPGETLTVLQSRQTKFGDILKVRWESLVFEIPSSAIIPVEEYELV
jgi:hypothetical protein